MRMILESHLVLFTAVIPAKYEILCFKLLSTLPSATLTLICEERGPSTCQDVKSVVIWGAFSFF